MITTMGTKEILDAVAAQGKAIASESQRRFAASLSDIAAGAPGIIRMQMDVVNRRDEVAKLEGEYLSIAQEETAKAATELSQGAITEEDVKSGKATLQEYFDRGVSAERIQELAAKGTNKRLEIVALIIRSKKLELLKAERDLAQMQHAESRQKISIPLERAKVLKEQSTALDQHLTGLWDEERKARTDLQEAREKLKVAEGRSMTAQFDNLDFTALSLLLTEPGLEKCYPAISRILEHQGTGPEKFSICLDLVSGGVRWFLAQPDIDNALTIKNLDNDEVPVELGPGAIDRRFAPLTVT